MKFTTEQILNKPKNKFYLFNICRNLKQINLIKNNTNYHIIKDYNNI